MAVLNRNMEERYPTRRVASGVTPSALAPPRGAFELHYRFHDATYSIADFILRTDTTGLIILKGEQILFEGYYQGAQSDDLFTAASVSMSFVSTLIGIAIAEGRIRSIDDRILGYLPELKGSAYETATIKQVLQMASGVGFSDDADAEALAAVLWAGRGGLYDFSRSFRSAYPPGERWNYADPNAEVLGALVARVTGRSLSAYLSEKLWRPLGAEASARWIIDQPGSAGREWAAAGLLMRLRDFARLGLLFANRGDWHGQALVPVDWVDTATRPRDPYVDYGKLAPDSKLGYGLLWWCLPDPHHNFFAFGGGGQFILVDAVRKLVVVKLSSWHSDWDDDKEAETEAFFAAVVDSVH